MALEPPAALCKNVAMPRLSQTFRVVIARTAFFVISIGPNVALTLFARHFGFSGAKYEVLKGVCMGGPAVFASYCLVHWLRKPTGAQTRL